jgi:hypothetical protein
MAMRVLYVKMDKLVEKKLFERLLPRAASPLSPTDPYRIQINLDQVSGVGDVTGFVIK